MRRWIREVSLEQLWRRGKHRRFRQTKTLERAQKTLEQRDAAELGQSAGTVGQDDKFMTHGSFLNNNGSLGKRSLFLFGRRLRVKAGGSPAENVMAPNLFSRFRYSPFLAQMVVIRRCNLACGYCSEFDKTSDPVPFAILEKRLEKLKALGTFGISLTGGEPTLHPDLPRLIRKCRELRFLRTGMISNGFFLKPELIEKLNTAGLQEMQISIDGVRRNETTEKVLDNLKKRLLALREHARFAVTVSGVIGAAPPAEAEDVVGFARELGFRPRVLLVHDGNGRLKLKPEEVKAFQSIVNTLPKSWADFSSYRKRLVRDGAAPFKCRAGSRYLYIDEFGNVNWCSQTRNVWSKPLMNYTTEDLREQFHTYKSCNQTCTLGCARSSSQLDNWRNQRPL
jgi:MoaA/NifB/PqqE/SkfB family radical SAM enzyme